MTVKHFLDDAYATTCDAEVIKVAENNGVVLDKTVFYATSGGQPGDNGFLERADGSTIRIDVAFYAPGDRDTIVHVVAQGEALPEPGEHLVAHIDWERRYKLMQMHTACHLLSVVCPFPVTGGSVGDTESRLDFDMSETIDKGEITRQMMAIVEDNHPIESRWITEAELDANPGLVKSKNVRPPRGAGHIRLVSIGENDAIDSQPCGGTHVSETAEIGAIHVGKIEKKGRENRRIRLRFGTPPDG